jgi:hypothetical protein
MPSPLPQEALGVEQDTRAKQLSAIAIANFSMVAYVMAYLLDFNLLLI